MKTKLLIFAMAVAVIGIYGCTGEQYTQMQNMHHRKIDSLRVMTKDDIISLSKAGVSDSLIINMMDATDSWFKLNTKDVLALRNAGVSEGVISAMMQQPPEQAQQGTNATTQQYYAYPPYFWYDGFYPYWWYYPSFSVRLGYRSFHPHYFNHGFHGGRGHHR